jgi:hypothetical protein
MRGALQGNNAQAPAEFMYFAVLGSNGGDVGSEAGKAMLSP